MTCEKILPFAKNTAILESDYTEALGEYLKKHVLPDVKVSLPRISESYANICFGNDQFHIFLHRRNVNATLNPAPCDPEDDYDEELPEKPDEEIYGRLKSEIITTITQSKLSNDYRYETVFEWDRIGLSIYNNLYRYNLYIEPSLFYDELGYQITTIVDCFIRQIKNQTTDLLADLVDCHFHKHSLGDDGFTAIVCECLDVYSIVAWSESLADNSNKTSLISSRPVFDDMNGPDFEVYCAKILGYNGFVDITLTQSSGDQGVDIIAYKDSIKYGIQCKCYSSDVGNKAVQEVLAGRTFYDCDVGVVLTNSRFTKAATDLAKKSRIQLWDRDKLMQLSSRMIDPKN